MGDGADENRDERVANVLKMGGSCIWAGTYLPALLDLIDIFGGGADVADDAAGKSVFLSFSLSLLLLSFSSLLLSH